MRTRFTDLVGCTVPIQLAAMGSLGLPPLAAAVAEAGGLGMLGWNGAPPAHLVWMLEETRRRTQGAFGVNFLVDGWRETANGEIEPEGLEAVHIAAPRARVVEFFYGPPDSVLVRAGHAGGALVSWQVGSAEEARQAEQVGCDFVVAQGTEAGGHVRGKTALLALLPQVVGAVRVPVVAAGGIGSGARMAQALRAGADAVRVGTRFVAATESEAHPAYIERLIAASADDTVLTEAFSTNWPNAPHRVLADCVRALHETTDEVVGDSARPWAPELRVPVHRGDAMVPLNVTRGRIEAMPHWAGTSVGEVSGRSPAAEIVAELLREAGSLDHSSPKIA